MKKYTTFNFDEVNSRWLGDIESSVRPTKESLAHQSEYTIVVSIEIPFNGRLEFLKGTENNLKSLSFELQDKLSKELEKYRHHAK